MKTVAILFVTANSVYKQFSDVEWFDIDRDARTWPGGCACVCHPPCRGWGCLRQFSNATSEEKDLAPWAVEQVRRNGGVLEHPRGSSLWKAVGLPRPGDGYDEWDGFTLDVNQSWFGHRAQKRTWLYMCGIKPRMVPKYPFKLGSGTHLITNNKRHPYGTLGWKPEVKRWEREATPIEFAEWLISVARVCTIPIR